MLALLQPLRKQTRAPNDSNKPGRRLPLLLQQARRGNGGSGTTAGLRTPRLPARPRLVGVAVGTPCLPSRREGSAKHTSRSRQGGDGERVVAWGSTLRLRPAPFPSASSAGEKKLLFTFVWVWGCKTQDTTLQSKFTFQRADINRSLIEGRILQTTPRMFPKYLVECLGRL